MPPERGAIYLYMIKVVQVIDTQFEFRIGKIYQSIFSRASKYHNKNYKSKYKDVIFEDIVFHQNLAFIRKYEVNILPTTLFFKDGELVFKKEGIMATNHILHILEEI